MYGKALDNVKVLNTRVNEAEKSTDKRKVEIDELISKLKEAEEDKEEIERKYIKFWDKYNALLKEKKKKEKV